MEHPGMLRLLPLFLGVALLAACGARTTEEDEELNNFAEARQRAATYYDGGDYYRAAAQYKRALEFRPDHVASRLGYAYSLMYTDLPSNLLLSLQEFDKIGELRDPRDEVKRVYGMALANRNMAQQLYNRANMRRREGRLAESDQDLNVAREHALRSMEYWKKVIAFDEEMAQTIAAATQRVSASLKPDAYVGLASCEVILGDPTTPEHFQRAVDYIEQYAEIARNARKFWMERRQRLLVEDPLKMGAQGQSGASTLSAEEKQRYEVKILNTIRKEIAVRQAMMETYLFLNRYPEAIQEAQRILDLDPETYEVLLLRGRAFAMLNPPNYEAALKDLRAYRATRDLSRLTEDVVKLNRLIQTYEQRLKQQETGSPDASGS